VRAAQTLIIETNHDEKLLQNDTKRPWSVKQRIMSRHGHLSNAAAADVLAELLAGGRLRRAVLGHLSRDCNSPELAVGTVRARLDAVIRALGFPSQAEPDREVERRKEILRELAEGRIAPDDAANLLETEPTK